MARKKSYTEKLLEKFALEEAKEKLERLLKIPQSERADLQVRVERGQLVVYRKESIPGDKPEWVRAIRLTPLGDGQYGLSVYGMQGRWEKTPFYDNLRGLVKVMTTQLGHFLANPW